METKQENGHLTEKFCNDYLLKYGMEHWWNQNQDPVDATIFSWIHYRNNMSRIVAKTGAETKTIAIIKAHAGTRPHNKDLNTDNKIIEFVSPLLMLSMQYTFGALKNDIKEKFRKSITLKNDWYFATFENRGNNPHSTHDIQIYLPDRHSPYPPPQILGKIRFYNELPIMYGNGIIENMLSHIEWVSKKWARGNCSNNKHNHLLLPVIIPFS